MNAAISNSAGAVVEALLAQFEYGDFIAKEWLHQQFGYDPRADSNLELQTYMRNMARLHDILAEDKHIILTDAEGGYRIALPAEFARLALKRFENAIAAGFAEAKRVIAATPLDKLNDEQRRELTDAQIHAARLRDLTKK